MKNITSLTVLGILIATLSLITVASCKKKKCKKDTVTNTRTINGFDYRSTSPYYNQVVVNFKFSQSTNTYSGDGACPLIDCQTGLVIQNVTVKKITFDYNIIFTLNAIQWNYQGVAVIDPGNSLNVGQVSNSCGSVSLGSFVIQSTNITYQ